MNNQANCDYDIAIIGGGLAGLTLAIQGADAGYRVVLFEKETYPFHKVCGEYISMESKDFLARCGVPFDQLELPHINKLHVSDTTGKGYDFSLPLGGFGVSRYLLDNTLYQLAKQKGATIFTGTKVQDIAYNDGLFTVNAAGINYTAKVATACFGKRSNLDLKWNRDFVNKKTGKINNLVAVKYHIRYPHDPGTIALHNFHNGYCGMSRIENGASCLCYLTTAENLKKSGNAIAAMEKSILSKNKQLYHIFNEAEHLYGQPVTISQVSFERKELVYDHIIMLGDAAGMITPLCGNGMSMAMHAAKIAFENISRLLAGQVTRQQLEDNYNKQWKDEFASRTRIGRIVQYFFGGETSTSLFLKTMNAVPGLSSLLIRQTHGKTF